MKLPKNKLYTLVTIAAVSLGILIALLTVLGLKDETTSSLADPSTEEGIYDTNSTEGIPPTDDNFAENTLYQTEEQMANPPGKVVYLTFDDGPCQYTEQLLDILDKYNVKATFFVTNQSTSFTDMIGETYRRGHTIAMHTYTHRFYEIYTSESAYYEDLYKIQAICEAQTGVTPWLVRFPGGTSNGVSKKYCEGIMTSLAYSVTEKGYSYCDWNVDSGDSLDGATQEGVTERVIADIQTVSRPIVLMHDTYSFTVESMEDIIVWGLTNGYTFLPITEDTPLVHHNIVN